MKSVFVDWTNENICQKWEFVGRDVLLEKKGERSEKNQNGIDEDDGYPIYNFAYPLFKNRIDKDDIFKACEETNCTVVYNTEDDRYYLALTGCGMDLSQDIASAYIIVDGCIDWDFLDSVYISKPLSVSKPNYFKILKELERQLRITIENSQSKLNEISSKLCSSEIEN